MERSCLITPWRRSQGFTLVELMVSMALGLGLMSLMIGTIDKVLHASRVSAEAAETLERGYFLMDAMDTWVAGTSPISSDMLSEVSAQRSIPMLVEYREGAVDLCETPDLASLPLASSGIALLEPGAWPCIPQRNLEVAALALLLEHRLPCRENCNGAGFYAVPRRCLFSGEAEQGETDGQGGADSTHPECDGIEFAGSPFGASEFGVDEGHKYQIVWRDAGVGRSSCFDNGKAFKVTRSLIFVRNYAWRVGDGIRAVMVRDLAEEPKARWLRSSMLAHGIDDWQVACLFDCFDMGDLSNGALLAPAIDLSFVVNARSQSISIQRVLAPRKAPVR
ncbi:prepilin-type N-terminal cleavage/methylation domain-containing protein [gamma proteobacterium HIMB55]|nr:prepilin-type N-terminal cleavage/methylation domain-containing protein [gamma proteobacterium HIMB55]